MAAAGPAVRPPEAGHGRRPPATARPAPQRSAGGSGTRGTGKPKGKSARSTKQRRNRRLKIGAAVIAGGLLLLGVFVGVVYASTDVPSPDSITTAQTTRIYYSDGTTEMARLGDENRTNVTLDQISKPARHAVLAAENRSFYTDPGISFTGIVRAAFNNVTGGSTQGGSTITQQYVKNAILKNSEQTFTRKFQELFLAIKLDNNYSKDKILENYLNTIYYGRGAYGIESAANTYFGVPAAQLTPQQGAVLAVLVRSPSRYDPEVSPQDAQDRWGKVLDAMVDEGWLSSQERAASVYPTVLPKTGSTLGLPNGPEGLVVKEVRNELMNKYQYTEQQIDAGGLRITTTINKDYEDAAKNSVADVMDGEPDTLRQALVSIDPKTGGVLAYYGGANGGGYDYALTPRQPGSSVKPYVLATALENGISVTARRDGSDRQMFPTGRRQAGAQLRRGLVPGVHPAGGDHQVAEHDVLRPDLRAGPEERPRPHAQDDGAARDVGRRQPEGQDDAGRPGDGRHRLGSGHRAVRDAPGRSGRRVRHVRCRRRAPRAVLRGQGDRLRGQPAPRPAGRPGPAGDPGRRRQRRHLCDRGRGAVLQAVARGRS